MLKATLLLSFLLFAPVLQAQIVDISDCRRLDEALERFDCYERLQTETPANITQSEPEADPQENTSPDQKNIVSRGLSVFTGFFNRDSSEQEQQEATEPPDEQLRQTNIIDRLDAFGRETILTDRVIEGADGGTELFDTVVQLEKTHYQRWLITLESGQVWRQMTDKRFNLRKGDGVSIYPSGWGKSYRLTSERLAGFIQVERID